MTDASPTPPPGGPRRIARVGGSLALAFAIIFAAWLVADRQGLGDLGQGGMNDNPLPKVGQMAPDFVVPDLLGQAHTLSEYRGQVVWVNFWGSWCQPCRAEMPELQAAYETLAPQGLVFLAISQRETPTDAALFAARNNVRFPVLTDPDQSLTFDGYPVNNYPTHILIGRDGRVYRIILSNLDQTQVTEAAEDLIANG
jgi:peroxiredoxin